MSDDMNEIDTTPLPFVCIYPKWGVFMNVRFRWKADVHNAQLECPLYTESGH